MTGKFRGQRLTYGKAIITVHDVYSATGQIRDVIELKGNVNSEMARVLNMRSSSRRTKSG